MTTTIDHAPPSGSESATATATTTAAAAATEVPAPTDTEPGPHPDKVQDAHRDVLLAVQHGLAANWDDDRPRVAVVEHNGVATVYVSTVHTLNPAIRADVRGAVRSALAPYVQLAPYTTVVFLRRGRP